MIEITVIVDPRLHAHAKGNSHWAKSAPTKALRQLAYLLASNQPKIKGHAVLDVLFCVPDRRRRDVLNMAQSIKPAIDGVVECGGIEGDHWEVLSVGELKVSVVKGQEQVEAILTFYPEPPF